MQKNDNSVAITVSTQIIEGLTNVFEKYRPDLLVVLGDIRNVPCLVMWQYLKYQLLIFVVVKKP